jgi:hypothetical protein
MNVPASPGRRASGDLEQDGEALVEAAVVAEEEPVVREVGDVVGSRAAARP